LVAVGRRLNFSYGNLVSVPARYCFRTGSIGWGLPETFGRGLPEDFAGAAVFLGCAASDFVARAVLIVDGGYSCET
jgi:NAD(P)-dependent dehydrogenase (short-subunit alcohol dehydrogenase family)